MAHDDKYQTSYVNLQYMRTTSHTHTRTCTRTHTIAQWKGTSRSQWYALLH